MYYLLLSYYLLLHYTHTNFWPKFCPTKKIIYYPMITGLGYAFIDRHSIKHKILKYITLKLYKLGLKNSEKVIFQNQDDRSLFVKLKIFS